MDTTSNQFSASSSFTTINNYSSPSSPSSLPKWDVFLSFYGKDTRKNFTSHLYSALDLAGILTFKDDPALEKGEEISSGLRHAIKHSRKCIVILSENYARSSWCLDELVEILGCKRTENSQVVPVFYYVKPSHIRHQKGSFGEALGVHKKRFSVDMIEKWKCALAEISELSGYHLKKDANENEADIIQKIVETVAPIDTTNVLHLEEQLFGIDCAVEEIYQRLSVESVRAIGICGMGGIGKTTAAKAFYNKYSKEFDISCFIENVKQNSRGGSPLLFLLKQLLVELLRKKDYVVRNIGSGMRQLKQILSSKKALIVLDDLDQSSHLEYLSRLCNLCSSGSRIMITTRDVNLLNQLKVDVSEVDIYMVKELAQIYSLELFSYHAFRKLIPPENFRELSISFTTYAQGLPLALKVLGSSLRGRTHLAFWKAKLEKIREFPDQGIQKILQMSYEELDDDTEKAIFLDIVFFFLGKDKDDTVHIFKSCNFFPEVGMPVLVERCLLRIDENNKLQMHNLIQDMGREVIRGESENGKRRRLYLHQGNACEALENLEGRDRIDSLILDLTTSQERRVSAKIFKRLPNLRLLEIINAHDVEGEFNNLFHELRCIRWSHCQWTSLPSSFCPQNLVSIEMPFSELKTLWKVNMPPVYLKSIDVSYSKNLKTIHDFGDSKLVEKILLFGCKNLKKIHPSIGRLTRLGHLDLGKCQRLKKLPKAIGQLTKLGHFDLHGCHSLERLPNPINQLTNLGYLNLAGCSNLKRLPEQLGDMLGLKLLNASNTAIERLPESIGGLTSLLSLRVSACKNLTILPNSIRKLKLLEVLHLDESSKLERLPEKLGKMQSLKVLNASRTSIEELPDSIGLLSGLEELGISRTKVTYLPNSISNLTSLTKLHARQRNMARIDFPDTLKILKLESLSLRCNVRVCLPIVLSFTSLKSLYLANEGEILPSGRTFSLSKLSNLEDLSLDNFTSIGSSFPKLPLNVKELSITGHASLEQLPDLSNLKRLERLYICKCIGLQELLPLSPHLQSIRVLTCPRLQNLPDLSKLKKLKHLAFIGCRNLKSVVIKPSSLQVGLDEYYSFEAHLPNREIAEWLSYKSSGTTVCIDIPPVLGDNFLGVALWVVYTCKTAMFDLWIRAVITNITEGSEEEYDMYAQTAERVGEVQSLVKCISGDDILVRSGDRIKVSFESLSSHLYCSDSDEEELCGEVNVEMCGAHVIQKTLSKKERKGKSAQKTVSKKRKRKSAFK